MPSWDYYYGQSRCPQCLADWRKPSSLVLITLAEGYTATHMTCLAENNWLEDVGLLIRYGYHAHTRCAGCGGCLKAMKLRRVDGIVLDAPWDVPEEWELH